MPGSPRDSPLDQSLPRGRHGYPLEEVVAYQRVRLLDAFVAEVHCRGFPDTTVARVCARAGTSTKTFYGAFDSKDECLLRAFEAGAAVVCGHGALAYRRAQGPWPVRATEALRTMLRILGDNPAFARLAFVELPRLGPVGMAQLDAVAAHCLRQLEGHWPRAVPAGLAPEVYLGALVAATVRLLADHTMAGRADQLADLTETLADWMAAWWAGSAGSAGSGHEDAGAGVGEGHRPTTRATATAPATA
ncbi:MAG: TetR/AcrR family transcriptional regulator [Acidimicrobiales bacterium]